MERPYVVCHMTQSIDGRVTGSFIGGAGRAGKAIEIERMIKGLLP